MAKKVRPPKAAIPAAGNTTQILAMLRSIDARLTKLEDDDDRRAELAAQIRAAREK